MSLQQIFVNIKLHDLIVLFPWQLNNELYLHLKKNLKLKVEKKCIDAGYVCKINDIISYKDGTLYPEDLTGNVTFKITYNARVCIPLPNTQIVCKIDQIFKSVIMAKNGPVVGLIKFTDININIFTINNTGNVIYKKTNKILDATDYIKVTVRSKRSYSGDNHIGIVGFIDDIASADDIANFMFKEYEDDNNEIQVYTSKIIEMNEDDTIDEGVEPLKINNLNNIMEL